MADDLLPVDISCPLCEHPARVIDEPAIPDWLFLEGCLCERYAVWPDLVANACLALISREHREWIRARIRDLRDLQREAWLVTDDGLLSGRLVVAPEPRNRPPWRRTDNA